MGFEEVKKLDFFIFASLTCSLIAPFFSNFFVAGNLSIFDVVLICALLARIPRLRFPQGVRLFASILLILTIFGLASLLVNGLSNIIDSEKILFTLRWTYYAILVVLLVSYVTAFPQFAKVLPLSILISSFITLCLTWLAWFESPRYVLGFIPMLHLIHDGVSTIINRNYLGFFLSISASVALFLSLTSHNGWSKASYALMALFLFSGVLLTFSKGAWLASILPIVLLPLITPRVTRMGKMGSDRAKPILSLILIVVFSSILLPLFGFDIGLFFEALEDRVAGSGDTNSERLQFAIESSQLMILNPVFGVGPGLYRDAAILQGFLPTSDPHNALLWIGSENGFVSFLLASFSIILCFYYLGRIFRSNKSRGSPFVISAACILIAIVSNVPVHGLPLVMKHYWVIAAYLIGLAEVCRAATRDSPNGFFQ